MILTTMCPNLLNVSRRTSLVTDLSRLPMNRVRVALWWNSSRSDSGNRNSQLSSSVTHNAVGQQHTQHTETHSCPALSHTTRSTTQATHRNSQLSSSVTHNAVSNTGNTPKLTAVQLCHTQCGQQHTQHTETHSYPALSHTTQSATQATHRTVYSTPTATESTLQKL